MDFLLGTVDKSKQDQVELIMSFNHDGLTPLDLAGAHQSNEAALVILHYFEENFPLIQSVFHGK